MSWTSEIDFFFQAEDGIRDLIVTGVQTCALPICVPDGGEQLILRDPRHQEHAALGRAHAAGLPLPRQGVLTPDRPSPQSRDRARGARRPPAAEPPTHTPRRDRRVGLSARGPRSRLPSLADRSPADRGGRETRLCPVPVRAVGPLRTPTPRLSRLTARATAAVDHRDRVLPPPLA